MFSGIIKEIGVLQKKERDSAYGSTAFTIQSREIIKVLKEGSSVSVNGACLTVEKLFKDAFKVSVMEETLSRTNLGLLKIPSRINLEPSLSYGQQIDGGFVSGHIDGLGKIVKKGIMQGGITLEIQFPAALKKFITFKGSITANGVNLTIIDIKENTFKIGLIPYTLRNTNLGDAKEDDMINLEVDLIARYIEAIYENSNRNIGFQ